MKIKFKTAAEIESYLDPRNKIFVDWTKKLIILSGPRIEALSLHGENNDIEQTTTALKYSIVYRHSMNKENKIA